MRLSDADTGRLPSDVLRFGYDCSAQAVGIVHFGIGAFHRAHQAWYTDAAMSAGDRNWAITGVSLRSANVAEQMNPQDGLYTLVERSADTPQARLIGAVRNVLVASEDPHGVIAALAAPTTHIASFTITEKGYCRKADGSLAPDLAGDGSVYRFLAEGLRCRRNANLPGLTLLSCDNLADNGAQLERLLGEYLAARDPALRDWFTEYCTCPATMVDRIVPATTDADRAEVQVLLGGLEDLACVVTEPFSQWVIEDRFAGPRPRWEQVGAELIADVAPYELAKLRMLNGAHSALAYLGLQRGHEFVHQAIVDPELAPIIDRLMREEGATSLSPAPGQKLDEYANALIERFRNPALNHRLSQIAMDGSQKIPQRWLNTLAFHQAQNRQCPAILSALGAWLKHVRGDHGVIDDPMAEPLRVAWETSGREKIVDVLFGEGKLIASTWRPNDAAREALAGELAD